MTQERRCGALVQHPCKGSTCLVNVYSERCSTGSRNGHSHNSGYDTFIQRLGRSSRQHDQAFFHFPVKGSELRHGVKCPSAVWPSLLPFRGPLLLTPARAGRARLCGAEIRIYLPPFYNEVAGCWGHICMTSSLTSTGPQQQPCFFRLEAEKAPAVLGAFRTEVATGGSVYGLC